MSNIVIGGRQTATQMFGIDGMAQLGPAIVRAVGKSFKDQNMRNPTQDEVRRRGEICLKWAMTLRGDLKWGIERIKDAMPDALRAALLGQDYKPSERQCWMPSDGN